MLSSVTIADKDGNDVVLHEDVPNGKRWLTQATGLRGVASIRSNHRVRPQAHGGINETRFEDGRTITLQGEVMSTVSIEDAFSEFALVAEPMIQTLDNGPALLKWTEGATGNQLQRAVKLDGDFDPVFQDAEAMLSYQAQFFAEDPRAYSQTLTTVTSDNITAVGGGMVFPKTYPYTFATSGGGTVSFTNAGNRPTSPVYRIYGLAVNPSIVLLGTAYRLVFNGTVEADTYLEIDVAKRTVMLGGMTNRLNFYDSVNSTWFDLPAGTSSLQLLASSGDDNTVLEIEARSAWA